MTKLGTWTLLLSIGTFWTLPLQAQTGTPFAITTLAGTSSLGDGGPATAALLEYPQSVVADASGNIYVGDNGNERIRVVDPSGNIRTLTIGTAASMKIDSTGTIYGTDGASLVFKILPNGNMVTLAGSTLGYTGDNGPATAATLNGPHGIAVDSAGDIFIADTFNNVIREITPDGRIQTIAGTGAAAFGREGIAAIKSAPRLSVRSRSGCRGQCLYRGRVPHSEGKP